MFTSEMMESKQGVLVIDHYTYESVQAFLEYIYCGEIDIERYPFDLLFELLLICDEYMVEDLHKICHKKLKSKINVNNVCDILVMADKQKLKELRAQCMDMIVLSFNEIIVKDSYNRLIKYPHLLLEISKEVAHQINPSAE